MGNAKNAKYAQGVTTKHMKQCKNMQNIMHFFLKATCKNIRKVKKERETH